MKVQIPYIDQQIELELPSRNLLFDVAPKDVPPAADFEGTLLAALQNPLGTAPLKDLVKPGGRVVLISDDNTRPTPTRRIIPILLDYLNQAGVPDSCIEIVLSSGTHRAMTPAEIELLQQSFAGLAPISAKVALVEVEPGPCAPPNIPRALALASVTMK